MQSKGRKMAHYEFEDGQRGVMVFQVGNVTRVILCAGLLLGTGHTTELAPNESYIKRERRVLRLRKERDVYLLRAKVIRRVKEGGRVNSPARRGGGAGFRRRKLLNGRGSRRASHRATAATGTRGRGSGAGGGGRGGATRKRDPGVALD